MEESLVRYEGWLDRVVAPEALEAEAMAEAERLAALPHHAYALGRGRAVGTGAVDIHEDALPRGDVGRQHRRGARGLDAAVERDWRAARAWLMQALEAG